MELPKIVQVGHYRYVLEVDQEYINGLPEQDDTVISGYTEFLKQKITLSEAPGRDYRRDTVLHEILHACIHASGFNPEEEAKELRYENLEERLVSTLSPILLDTLRRNPYLVKYLLDD